MSEMDNCLLLVVNNQQSYDCCGLTGVSGLNTTDKVSMYEMPLIYMFGGLGLGLGIACISSL